MNRAPRLMAIRALAGRGLALVPGRIRSAEDEIAIDRWALALQHAGVDCVQLRDRYAPDRQVWEAAISVVTALSTPRSRPGAATGTEETESRPLVLINRRPDIAAAAGAAGVHLPTSGLPTRAVRDAFGADFVIGRSTHSLEEVAAARREGADYVVFGPVFATPEKLRYGAPLGLEQLARAAALGIPVLAIGGITLERLPEVAEAGASGAAAIRLFADPGRAAAIVERARAVFAPIGAPAHA